MKTLSLVLLIAASVAFVLMGCSDNSSPVVSPTNEATNTLGSTMSTPSANISLAKKGPVVHLAIGCAHVSDLYGTVVKWTYSFAALRYADGTSSGEVEFTDHAGTRFHGTVFDLKVQGNKAKLCWTYSSGVLVNSPGVVIQLKGMFGCAVVEDNDKGRKETGPDMMSGYLWTDGSDLPSPTTIADVTGWTPDQFITWVETNFLPPGLSAFVLSNRGSIEVR